MPHVVWRPKAREEARQIIDYIADRNPAAAVRLADLFEHHAEWLADLPYMHRAGRLTGTREALVTPNYILVYVDPADVVEVLNVQHIGQQYP